LDAAAETLELGHEPALERGVPRGAGDARTERDLTDDPLLGACAVDRVPRRGPAAGERNPRERPGGEHATQDREPARHQNVSWPRTSTRTLRLMIAVCRLRSCRKPSSTLPVMLLLKPEE